MTVWTLIKSLHLLTGIFWLGAALTVTFFIVPAARNLGPAAGPMMGQLMNTKKLPLSITSASALTLLTGFLLIARIWPLNSVYLFSTWSGLGLLLGTVFGTLAFFWGILFQGVNAAKLAKLTVQIQTSPTAEIAAQIQKVQNKLRYGGYVGVCLISVALIGMILTHPL